MNYLAWSNLPLLGMLVTGTSGCSAGREKIGSYASYYVHYETISSRLIDHLPPRAERWQSR
jgi:hypothetical protein